MAQSLPEKIAQRIRTDYIDSSFSEKTDKMPTLRQLCDQYGVSKSTVSYALSILQHAGLIWKRQGSGIRILPEAKEEGDGKKLLGFLKPWIRRNELTMDLYEGVEQAAGRAGYQLVTGCSGDDYENERRLVQEMRQGGCQGIVMYPGSRPFSDMREDYLRNEMRDFPIVLVDWAYADQRRTMVVFDNYHAAYNIVEALVSEGHDRIAYAMRPETSTAVWNRAGRDRDEGVMEALEAFGIPESCRFPWRTGWRVGDPDDENLEWLDKWREMPNRPTALITRHDNHAVSLIRAARELDIDIPHDLRLVGFDNLSVGESVFPPFPTTAPNFKRAGHTAVRALLKEICGEVTMPGRFVLEVPILWREMSSTSRQAPRQALPK